MNQNDFIVSSYSVKQVIRLSRLVLKLRNQAIPSESFTPFSLSLFDKLRQLMSDLDPSQKRRQEKPARIVPEARSTRSNQAKTAKLMAPKRSRVELKCVDKDELALDKAQNETTAINPSTVRSCRMNRRKPAVPPNFEVKIEVEERSGARTRSQRSSVPLKATLERATKSKGKAGKAPDTATRIKIESVETFYTPIAQPIVAPTGTVVELPDMPEFPMNVPNESKSYHLICHIGFAVIEKNGSKQILFKCFLPGCPFVLSDEGTFVEHLRLKHSAIVWSRYCSACCGVATFQYNVTIMDEMKHLLLCHLKKDSMSFNVSREGQSSSDGKMVWDPSSLAENFFSDVEPFKLRPWLDEEADKKLSSAIAVMLQENCLAATFKCMEKSCIFYTSLDTVFADHLKRHKTLDSRNGQDGCAYCKFSSADEDELVAHISAEHNYDMYQCTNCFYRSAASANVHTHIRVYHPEKALVIIECLPKQRLHESTMIKSAISVENVEQMVLPMFCVICQQRFFVIGAYEHHLDSHENINEFKKMCSKCDKIANVQTLMTHYEECKGIGLYQCLFCQFGCNSLNVFKTHLANQHSSKLPLYCKRTGDHTVN